MGIAFDNLVDGEALHFMQVVLDPVVQVFREQILQRYEVLGWLRLAVRPNLDIRILALQV